MIIKPMFRKTEEPALKLAELLMNRYSVSMWLTTRRGKEKSIGDAHFRTEWADKMTASNLINLANSAKLSKGNKTYFLTNSRIPYIIFVFAPSAEKAHQIVMKKLARELAR